MQPMGWIEPSAERVSRWIARSTSTRASIRTHFAAVRLSADEIAASAQFLLFGIDGDQAVPGGDARYTHDRQLRIRRQTQRGALVPATLHGRHVEKHALVLSSSGPRAAWLNQPPAGRRRPANEHRGRQAPRAPCRGLREIDGSRPLAGRTLAGMLILMARQVSTSSTHSGQRHHVHLERLLRGGIEPVGHVHGCRLVRLEL